jgi:hypothetical protein
LIAGVADRVAPAVVVVVVVMIADEGKNGFAAVEAAVLADVESKGAEDETNGFVAEDAE